MDFQNGIVCSNREERGYWFIFRDARLLVSAESNDFSLPLIKHPGELGIRALSEIYLGKLDGKNLFACEASDDNEPLNNCCGTSEHNFANIRELYQSMGDDYFALALRALHIKNWHHDWNFCPACGKELELSETERAKICTECGRIHYPVISPAIIVAVRKGDKLLLAHNNRFPKRIRYSILAGFVDAGESLEEAVEREVFEEVGIKIKNIRYFGSQGWPFPRSLMLGFTAEHESGEIAVDNVEIGHADWYSSDNMPEIPPYGSISRLLIEDFRKNYG